MIKIGVVGYGKLGKSVGAGVEEASDMELVGYFSRREIKDNPKVISIDKIRDYKEEIDVLVLCTSSDHDIESQGPDLIRDFNTVDSFDNHSKIYDYYNKMDTIARENNTLALISTGWDPGLFSIIRTYSEAILPSAQTYTFWGKGVSQGHSSAVRSLDGVKEACQYTVPNEDLIKDIRQGEKVQYTKENAHKREVYVVAEDGFDKDTIEENIKNMPDYFKEYDTEVHFISQDDFDKNHRGQEHGGRVIRAGDTYGSTRSVVEFSLDLESNPDFTAAVDIAYARAIYRLKKEGQKGAKTVLDIPPLYLSILEKDYLLKNII